MKVLQFFALFLLPCFISSSPTLRLQKRITWTPDFELEFYDQQQQQQLFEDFLGEMNGVMAMAEVASRTPQTSTSFAYFFGRQQQPQAAQIQTVFDNIRHLGRDSRTLRVLFTDIPLSISGNTVAQMSRDRRTLRIYVPGYNAYPRHSIVRSRPVDPASRIDHYRTRATTLLHEMTHIPFIGGFVTLSGTRNNQQIDYRFPADIPRSNPAYQYRNQVAYDQRRTHALAQFSPVAAASNADNYAMYALALWLQTFNRKKVPDCKDLPAPCDEWDPSGSRKYVPKPPLPGAGLVSWWASDF